MSLAMQNLRLLYNAWRLARSGQLRAIPLSHHDPVSRVIPISRGGLPDKDTWDLLSGLLASHALSLEEQSVGARGSRALMGAFILAASRRHQIPQSDLLQELPSPGGLLRPLLTLRPAITLPPFFELPSWVGGPEDAAQTQLLAQGRELLALGRYEDADITLSAARDRRMDHAPTLALLAVARARNEARDPATRARDAETMVKLAFLLAPEDPEVRQAHDQILGALAPGRSRRREVVGGR